MINFLRGLRDLVSNMNTLLDRMGELETEMHTQRDYLGHANLNIRDIQDELITLKEGCEND